MAEHDYHKLAKLLQQKGIENPRVLKAVANTPRHKFMPPEMQSFATDDRALPIGANQTISQPYIVARMTESLLTDGEIEKVLEIGTGSGYQAAILRQVCKQVYTIERIESLYEKTSQLFGTLQYQNIHTRYGDGRLGWSEHAPYNAIIVTAATQDVPQALLAQLADGGKMIIPVGDSYSQELQLIIRHDDQYKMQLLDPVIFVPLKSGTE